MPRQKSLLTVIRDRVQQEVRSAMQSLLGSLFTAKASEERAPPSQAAAWSWSAAGIEEQGGIDGEDRRTLDAVGDPHPEGAAPAPPGVLRDARPRPHALRGGGD
jgi:hypothetical protein